MTTDQTEYIYGTAGSLVMICRKCDRDHFRNAHAVLVLGHKEYCVWCGQEITPATKSDYEVSAPPPKSSRPIDYDTD